MIANLISSRELKLMEGLQLAYCTEEKMLLSLKICITIYKFINLKEILLEILLSLLTHVLLKRILYKGI